MAEEKVGETVMWCKDCFAYVPWIHNCRKKLRSALQYGDDDTGC